MRKTNDQGVNLIKYYESGPNGPQLKAYRDIKGILTIGYGHTGPDVLDGQQIDEPTAELLLRHDLTTAEDTVERCVRTPLSDDEFAACVSLCYNIGMTAFSKSTLVQLLNQSKFQEAADQFLVWDKSNGQVIGGLLARRRAERDLFLSS